MFCAKLLMKFFLDCSNIKIRAYTHMMNLACLWVSFVIHFLFLSQSKQRPIQNESIYSNWMDTMTTICDDITTESWVIMKFVSEINGQ